MTPPETFDGIIPLQFRAGGHEFDGPRASRKTTPLLSFVQERLSTSTAELFIPVGA